VSYLESMIDLLFLISCLKDLILVQ